MSGNNKIYIRDLKNFLIKNKITPEKFSEDVQLSHMTIRRWLKQPEHKSIPSKYYQSLAPRLLGGAEGQVFPSGETITGGMLSMLEVGKALGALDVDLLMKEMEKSGKDYKDFKTLHLDLLKKIKESKLDKIFTHYCKQLFNAAKSSTIPLQARAVAIGSLLYFITPIDLIPDYIPVIGFMDDLLVLSLALEFLRRSKRSS